MAAQNFGVEGVAKKVKGQHFGTSGAARKVKAGYFGENGVARKFYSGLDIKPALADNDWATIATVSESGKASTYWSVGDEKDITVGGETLTLVIMGFDHDDLAGGGKAGITFGMKHLMTDTRQMNSTGTNVGGFTGSAMYTWLQNTLFGQLPADLKSVVKSVNKKTAAGNNSSTINTNAMKLFLFSEIEVHGVTHSSAIGEGSQYSYFATAANRIKKVKNGAGAATVWWERSPPPAGTSKFGTTNNYGNPGSYDANRYYGVCFGFCV